MKNFEKFSENAQYWAKIVEDSARGFVSGYSMLFYNFNIHGHLVPDGLEGVICQGGVN